DRFPHDGRSDGNERQSVGEGGKDADAVGAESPSRRCRPLCGPEAIPREDEGQGVAEVVAGIGHQGEAVGQGAGDSLADDEGERQGDGEPETRAAARLSTVGMAVRYETSWMNPSGRALGPRNRPSRRFVVAEIISRTSRGEIFGIPKNP